MPVLSNFPSADNSLDEWKSGIEAEVAAVHDLHTDIMLSMANLTQLKPEFANSVEECTDSTKVYVLPDGYIYGIREVENYNLLKLSEVLYSTRLQNDTAGTVASTINNLVTGWMPCEYGKWYCPSVLVDGVRMNNWGSSNALFTRMNVKLSDGSIVYKNTNDFTWRELMSDAALMDYVIKITDEDAIAFRIQIYCSNDISTSAFFSAYEPMIIEGDTKEDAYTKATTYNYFDGDAETGVECYNTGHAFVPADYENRILSLESNTSELQKKMTELEANVENPASASPYYRDVNYGILPSSYYQGLDDSYETEGFGFWTTTYADYMTAWKSLVANHSNYVAETVLGTASDGQTIYLYDFKPVRIINQQKDIPKIILIAGQHGGEVANIFGLYYFIKNLLNKWNKHPVLEYLRNHVELMIVPVVNTYGFDNHEYKNANGVNINRNYDSGWVLEEDTTSSQYGGAEPFDQPETQIVRDLLLNNKDAVLVVDSHVNGGGIVDEYSDINYYGICTSTDSYYNRMVDAVAHNLSAISANFNLDYELNQPNTIMGFLNHYNGAGLMRMWAVDNNLVGTLLEGFGGFPNATSSHTPEVFKANEEIIVNWIITALNYLSK